MFFCVPLRREKLMPMTARLVCICVGALLVTENAAAQPPAKPRGEPKWTVEVHAGAAAGAAGSGGRAVQFPAGPSFTTEPGFESRTIPSWYFGGGAALFNAVNAQFASQFNQRFSQIVPLDPVLSSTALTRKGGVAFGARLARQLSSRYGIEFSVDRSTESVRLSDAAVQGIEATRASFESAFSGLLATIPMTGLRVTSTADLVDGSTSSQTSFTAALTIALTSGRRFAPYVVLGGGGVTTDVDDLSATLRGNYQFRLIDAFPFNESDTVVVRFTERDSAPIGLAGGGFTYDVGRRQALRFDVRVHVGPGGHSTTVVATPSVSSGTAAIALPSRTNPSVQFSTLPGSPSSLSGNLPALEIFSGGGVTTRVLVSFGYAVRF